MSSIVMAMMWVPPSDESLGSMPMWAGRRSCVGEPSTRKTSC